MGKTPVPLVSQVERQIAHGLRVARQRAGLSQTHAAQRLGTTTRSLSRYETNRTRIPASIITRAQQEFGPLLPGLILGQSTQAAERVAQEYGEQLGASLTEDEVQLLSHYRKLKAVHRGEIALSRLLAISADPPPKKKA